jgi:hypothetical protein
MLNNKSILPIALLSSILFLSGCSFVRIQNVSASSVTVSVNVPDSGAASTRNIQSGGIVDVFSTHGGSYTVSIIPNERYRETLEHLQDQITKKLFEERATLSAEEVKQLAENLNNIDKLIDELAKPMPSCSGYLPDFETVITIVSYDDFNAEYNLSCSSGSQ